MATRSRSSGLLDPDYLSRVISECEDTRLQNVLMATPDREAAALCMVLQEGLTDHLLNLISLKKAGRIREEMQRLRRVQITPEMHQRFAQNLLRRLDGRRAEHLSSYFKPRSESASQARSKPGKHPSQGSEPSSLLRSESRKQSGPNASSGPGGSRR